jgi:hypothetical protein
MAHPPLRFAAVAAFALTWAVPAVGEESTAQTLFDQGMKEMAAENYAEACPALMESLRLDSKPSTMFQLATCVDKLGKVALALRHYEEYLSRYERMSEAERAAEGTRPDEARKQMSILQTVVPTLTIEVPASSPEGTVVEHDGEELPRARWNQPLRVDPGTHRVVVRVPGREPEEYTESVAKGDTATIHVKTAAAPEPVEPTAEAPSESGGSGQRTAAYVAWTIGGVAGAASLVAGAVALANRGTIKDNCDGAICTQEGKDAADTAQVGATISNIGLVVGGLGLVAGIVLFATAPDSTEKADGGSVTVGLGLGRIAMEGTW